MPGRELEKYRLAVHHHDCKSTDCDPLIFEQLGVRLLTECPGADLIIMDELGYLERNSFTFQQVVLDTLARDIPVIGTMRKGDIPWHESIKYDSRISILEVTLENRDTLPCEIASMLSSYIGK